MISRLFADRRRLAVLRRIDSPAAVSLPKRVCALRLTFIPHRTTIRKARISSAPPISPHSSTMVAKTKSVWPSGRYLRWLWLPLR